jgi:hypothetical protein
VILPAHLLILDRSTYTLWKEKSYGKHGRPKQGRLRGFLDIDYGVCKLDWQVTPCLIKKLTGIIGRRFGKILFLIAAKTLRPN